MKKAEFIAKVMEKGGYDTQKDAQKAVDAVFGAVSDVLAAGDSVQILGFGSFSVKERAARQAHNPATGELIDVPAAKVPAFKAGSALKKIVSE